MSAQPPQPSPPPADVAYFGFNGPIESNSVTRICTALNYAVTQGYAGVHIAFSSLGGFTADGIYLYNHIRALPVPITMHATGNIASVAVAIFLAGKVRLCSKHVLFMIHPTTVPSSAEGMTWERLNSAMTAALAEEQRTENILRDRAPLIPNEHLHARRVREVHFTPEDALKFGIVDAIEEFSLPQGADIAQI